MLVSTAAATLIVSYVSTYTLLHGHMFPPLGRSASRNHHSLLRHKRQRKSKNNTKDKYTIKHTKNRGLQNRQQENTTAIYTKQDAQLSQRDRAAGCVIVFAKSRRLELGDNILRTL